MRARLPAIAMSLLALGVSTAAGRGDDEALTFSIRDETAPAGSMVQMKVRETEPTPISGGRPRMTFAPELIDRITGVSLFAPTGEAGGAALIDASSVTLTYVTTTPFSGGEYPILTVSMLLREGLPAGSSALFTLEPSSIWTVDGRTIGTQRSSGTATVGGTLAITDVIPAGATFPAGTVISVRGVGFDGNTRLKLNGDRQDDAQVVGPNEIRFTLTEPTNMAGAELRVDDSEDQNTTYYSYLRGSAAAISRRPLLASALPVFSGVARTISTLRPLPALNPAHQYAAVAVQNPGLERADLTLVLYAANGALLDTASRSLPSGQRWLLEVSELIPGWRRLRTGSSYLRVYSSRPIQAFDLIVDERSRSITPRLPTEATLLNGGGSAAPLGGGAPVGGGRGDGGQ